MTASGPTQAARTLPTSVYIVVVIGVLAISTSAILIRYAQADGMSSLLIAAARLVLAALALTPFVLRRYREHITGLGRRDALLMLTSGLFLALHFATWVTSLEYTSVLVSVVLVTSSPLWVALLEFFILRARLTNLIIAGLLISIGGTVLIGIGGAGDDTQIFSGTDTLIGGALSLAGAVSVAIYLIIGRSLRQRMPLVPYIWLVYGTAALLLCAALLVTQTPVAGFEPTSYLWLVGLAVFPQLIGHTSLNYAIAYLPATLISMITQLEPLAAALLAFLLFGEIPLPLQIVGSAIVLAGVMLANYGQSRRNKREKRAS